MGFEAFDLQINDGIARITLNQPDRGNPFDGTFCQEFSEIAVVCQEHPDVRVVLVQANGPYFSVGGDLKTFTRDRDDLPRFIRQASGALHSGVSRFARMDAPVIFACHSLVTGGAVALTASADFVLATQDARFYAAFTGIGFSCDSGASHFLPRRVGHRRAYDFLVRNRMWSAAEAQDYGLVSEVVEDHAALRQAADALAAELARGPTLAFGEIKRLLLSAMEQPLEAQLELESQAITRMSRTNDSWGALNDLLAKRKPSFSGT
jgi:2-(1,2-epoxy-1,2-dihydrophenyl)acetyl-CoA isomerase